MKHKVFGALLVVLFLAGCAAPTPQIVRETVVVTLPPWPTYSPYPTYTPAPTCAPAFQSPIEMPTQTPPPAATSTWTPTSAATLTQTPTPTTMPTWTPTPAPGPTSTSSSDLSALEQEMLEAVNEEREIWGLPPYQVDELLSRVARAHAQDMAARGYISHITPEGKTYHDRLLEYGVAFERAGENIYANTLPADEIVEQTLQWFMDDPPHRDNIIHIEYTHIGVGVGQSEAGMYVFALDFIQ